jgi:serine/threonine protein kinase/WD40 repeat protein
MTTLAPNDLIDFLSKQQLLAAAHLDSLLRERDQFSNIEELSDQLLQRGWITAYQQAQLLAGEGDKLIFGPYRILEPLGEGGMGLVLKAWHPRLDRMVALKIIRPQVLAARPDILSRFHREARAIAQLHHPNVVMLYDADEIDGINYLAMEYVEGVTLEKMVRQNGPLGYKQACDYMRQAALGLQHAQDCGMVHRDIKPSNLLVSIKPGGSKRSSITLKRPALVTVRDRELNTQQGNGRSEGAWGIMKILDMGLARLQESLDDDNNKSATPLTRAGALLGTPDFISPEQARDPRSVDIRADIYSLGCTFYYILSGRPPFPGGTDVQKLLRHQTEQPYPIEELRPHIPPVVCNIISKLLSKSAEDRHQNPQALADDLANLLAHVSATSTPPRGNPMVPFPEEPTHEPPAETPVPMAQVSTFPEGDDQPEIRNAEPIECATAITNMISAPENLEPFAILSTAHAGIVNALALTDDGRRLVSGGVDGRVRLWEVNGPQPRELAYLPRPSGEIQCLAFATDEPYVAVGGTQHSNARVWRWDWNEGRVFDWGSFPDEKRGIGGMAFAQDGMMFAAGVGSQVAVWKINKRNASSRTTLKGHLNSVRALAFSPDRRLLASAGEGKTLRLWGFGWLGTSLKAKVDGHNDIITTIAFSSDGKKLATAGLDRLIVLWDPLTPTEDGAVTLVGHTSSIRQIRFVPSGKQLISVGENGQVIFWDVASGSKLREFQLQVPMVCSLAISPDGKRIATGSSDGRVAIFDISVTLATVIS